MSDVIDINTREPIIAISKSDQSRFCDCRRVWIDTHERTVKCRDCGKVIDPFAWMHRFANSEGSLIQRIEHLENTYKEKYAALELLKGEEQKVKARIRSAKTTLLKDMGI